MAEKNPLLTIEPQEDDDIEVAHVPERPANNSSVISLANPPDSTKNRIIDISIKDTNAMKTFKEILQRENILTDINILVIGITGQGKSALINSLIELERKIVPEGSRSAASTTRPQSYTYPNIIPGVSVTIIDTPGLQDAQKKEHKYIQEMKNECREISLVLYCMKMSDHRFTDDDAVAMKKLHQMFGQKFWERVVIVLTFANRETLDKWDDRDEDDESEEPDEEDEEAWKKLRKKRLAGRVQIRKEELNTTINELLQLHKSGKHQKAVKKIEFEVLPAGYYISKHDRALSGVNWSHDLIALCCNAAKHKQKLNLNKKIYLSVIIDNRGEVKVENEEKILSDEAAALKKAFKDLDFAVLYFNSLSSESIATLLEAISKADHSQLSMIALVFLSKGKTPELYDGVGVVSYPAVFSHFQKCPIPVIYFFDLANDDIQKKKKSTVDDTTQNENDDVLISGENDSANDGAALVQNENDPVIDDTCVRIKNDSTTNEIHENDSVYAQNEKNFTDGPTPDETYFNLPQHICPSNSLVLAVHSSESSPVLKEFMKKLSHTSVQETFKTVCAKYSTIVKCICHNIVGNNLYIIKSINDSADTLEQKLEVYHSIWYLIRCKTIDKMEENKEEIMSIVHKERAIRLATTVSGAVVGTGLAITGIALIPFTFGGSIAVSVLGGAAGAAAATGSIVAIFVSKALNNKKLKKAQEHINLDQQISLMINEEAHKYNQIMTSAPSHIPESSVIGLQGVVAVGMRGAGAGIAIGVEGTVETAALALRNTGRVAGMALAGASLAVTIPIDIGMIAYHSYSIHKAKNDPTGKTESNKAVKSIYNQIETLLKGMCHAVNEDEYQVQTERNIPKNAECGYEIEVPVKGKEKHTVTVRTLFSGPFVYPDGYTLVSAVYDITMPELPQPATIKLEHCVDESDQTRPDLCFAIGSVDLKEKKIIIKEVNQEFNGSIQQKSSCLLCILYKRALQKTTIVKYAAQYYYVKSYRNYWTLNILFTKFLCANLKHAQSTCTSDIQCSHYEFIFTSDKLDLTCFKSTIDVPGWIISPTNGEEMPDTISMQEINTAELRKGSAKVLKKAFPSISLNIYIFNEAIASDEINEWFEIGGTNLRINIKRRKE